jgi:CheY-like chemotaxis protein
MPATPGFPPRLLIVEDAADVRELLITQFRRHGYEVDVARDGSEVLAMARHTRPDAVLMDLNMPEVDGVEATRLLKGNPETADIPVVAITAAPSEFGEDAALAAGCVAFFVKPWEPKKLEEAIRHAITRRHQAAPPAAAGNGVLRGVRVLAVDDEPDSLGAVVLMLTLSGATVEARDSAASALKAAPGFRPDIVVCDLAMPGEDGFALLRQLRDAGIGVPVVALTAHAYPEHRQRAIDAGFSTFVTKPVDPATVVGTLAQALGRS